jgi:hypothetical protein
MLRQMASVYDGETTNTYRIWIKVLGKAPVVRPRKR